VAGFFDFINSFQKLFLIRIQALESDSAVSNGSHGKYMKYINFPWPLVVAAHYREKRARALRSNESF